MLIPVITAYRYDKDGYLIGTDPVMEGFLPPDDTLLKPETKEGYWPKFVDGEWTYEKMPESSEDFSNMNIEIDYQSNTPHTEELRRLIRKFASSEHEPGKFVLNQDPDTNNLSVVKMPEYTEEEKVKLRDAERTQRAYDLCDRLLEALLMNDEALIASIREEYKNLQYHFE